MMDRRLVIGSVLAAGLAGHAKGAERPARLPAWPPREGMPLWPGRPPGARSRLPTYAPSMNGDAGHRQLWLRGIATPMLHVYRPAKPNGIGILSIPGGGYGFLSVQNEGMDVARVLGAVGFTLFVLSYRLPSEGWDAQADVPLQDAQRAMRLIRANAAGFGVDPVRTGILGFSAGGHLAASLATGHDDAVYRPIDDADRQSARPAFAGLIYPVTTLRDPFTHRGSRDALLGPAPAAALIDRRSPLLHVTDRTPPCFLVHAIDDLVVPVECSTGWVAACRAAGVPVAAQLLEQGGHGFGMQLPDSNFGALWPQAFARWARAHGGRPTP
ncbi:MAG TPA: alpha/beta hydrolase [Sphingomonas sp.]|jgi:acetyl esterase/lipase|uniref:alpha/beta hydrolase n=1 Tax=Sphingomonas sp. TaxID=28214 RepID=UPI002EF29C6F